MKSKSLLKVLLFAIIATAGISSCSFSKGDIELDDSERARIVEAVRAELASAPSIDSLANTPVIVSPSIYHNGNKISRDTLRLVATIIPFVFVIAVVWMLLYYKNKNLMAKYRVIELSINRSEKLPEVFYTGAKATNMALNRRRLFNGMIWVGFGLTAMAFFSTVEVKAMVAVSLLPIFIGVAKIVCYFIEQKSIKNQDNTDSCNAD